MQVVMLKSKIHGATITNLKLHYEGSITVDIGLLEKANILPGEQVHVLNLNTGERFVTYAIAGPRNSHCVVLNGPAARLGEVGDKVIIISYAMMDPEAAKKFRPRVLKLGQSNRPLKK